MKLGMVGLGRMGANMSERLRRAGHEVVGYDHTPSRGDVESLADLVAALDPPRAVWLMVPSGDPTQQTLDELSGLLSEGDVVVDGGNSHYVESVRRAAAFAERAIGFVDAGVSGGIWGLDEGYALMVGGADADVARLQPVFDALKPADGGFVHAGAVGSGHFTKMVHNGVEYGLMHAYAEGYELLAKSEFGLDPAAIVESWRTGTVIRSWLLDLLARGLAADPGLDAVRGWADDSGEGRWTVEEAIRLAVPLHVIASALFARFSSREEESPAMKVIATLRNQFGGHALHEAESAHEAEARSAVEASAATT
ncbi:MAG: phosphogluconate dehydrogenase (NAD(+)-dependent, decarboxylating) [Mycobacteriales bacterium]|nr:decarboxylating 6-phosphogluconate dehydrogenase [Frankia sp.]